MRRLSRPFIDTARLSAIRRKNYQESDLQWKKPAKFKCDPTCLAGWSQRGLAPGGGGCRGRGGRAVRRGGGAWLRQQLPMPAAQLSAGPEQLPDGWAASGRPPAAAGSAAAVAAEVAGPTEGLQNYLNVSVSIQTLHS